MVKRPYSTNEPSSTRSAMFSRAVRPFPACRRSTASGRAASSVDARRRSNSARSSRMGSSGPVIEVRDGGGDLVEQCVDLILVVAALAERRLGEPDAADIVGRQVTAALDPPGHQLQEVVHRLLLVAAFTPGRLFERRVPNIFGRQALAHGVRC